jgi:hypothetical protein
VGTRDDDAAWREIVDNYGEHPALPADLEGDPPEGPAPDEAAPDSAPDTFPEVFYVAPFRLEPDDTFVPPPLPPAPDIAPDRRFAWLGLVTPPLLFIVTSLLSYPLPAVVNGILVVVFVGSFGYLVATMSREPRDPDDDGARL